jgi:2Fe-2S ferredoxin
MTTIVVIDGQGRELSVAAADGLSVMEVLRPLDLGIEGECEGSAACATCHVWVDPLWFDRLAPASDAEADMLDCAFRTRATSRLCCQIPVTPALDGLRVSVPKR